MKPQTAKRKTYPSDISREQFELIREDLENYKRKTKPREVDLYDVFCGLLHVLKSGCQWRMLPSDFPKWGVVYSYYSQWGERKEGKPSLLEQGLKNPLARPASTMGETRARPSAFLTPRV